jgi:poly(hydroxyalkanoate) depolymerase family esterase
MARRPPKTTIARSFQRHFETMARRAMRAGSKAMAQAIGLAPAKKVRRRAASATTAAKAATKAAAAVIASRLQDAKAPRPPALRGSTPSGAWSTGIATAPAGTRRYRLFRPAGVQRTERLPLLVMLHGCGQDGHALATISRMNRLAAKERFLVLYPEQDRLHNAQGCWNWFESRSGRAQGEAAIIDVAIDQVCMRQPVDRERVAIAGFSAGAGMAALLATLRPQRFKAIAMHSGVAPGLASSSATALSAMHGRRHAPALSVAGMASVLPPLLVIQGSADGVVAAVNGAEAVRLWTQHDKAHAKPARQVQRGARHAATVTDYRSVSGRLVATLCVIEDLGHAWSGGAPGHRYSDPVGPDAARLIWAFCAKRFATVLQSAAKQ